MASTNPPFPSADSDEVKGFDVLRWRSALSVAIAMADTSEKMLVVVTMCEHLRPWLEADQRAISGEQELPLVGSEPVVGEERSLNVDGRDGDGEGGQVPEVPGQ